MRFADAYTVFVTDQLAACRDFYVRWFGFDVVFEADWFVYLHNGEGAPVSLAFMHPDHPSSPPSPDDFIGDGSFLTLQVEDAQAEYDRLVAGHLRPSLALREEPWGQKRFGLVDPAGIWVDVVEQIEPQAGWWDRYMSGTST